MRVWTPFAVACSFLVSVHSGQRWVCGLYLSLAVFRRQPNVSVHPILPWMSPTFMQSKLVCTVLAWLLADPGDTVWCMHTRLTGLLSVRWIWVHLEFEIIEIRNTIMDGAIELASWKLFKVIKTNKAWCVAVISLSLLWVCGLDRGGWGLRSWTDGDLDVLTVS